MPCERDNNQLLMSEFCLHLPAEREEVDIEAVKVFGEDSKDFVKLVTADP